MSSVVKKIIAIFVIVLFLSLIILYKVMTSRIYYNDSVVNGNTIGNLYGNGLFCELDGVVFFANPNDDNALYSMNPDETEVKKICDDRVYYINADEHYIYYSRDNNNDESQMSFLNVNTNSLCRIKHNGKQITILDEDISSTLALCQNTLLYHHYNKEEATTLYSIGIDGKDKKQLFNNSTDPRCLVGESLFYSGVENDHNIHVMRLSSLGSSVVSYEWAYMPTVEGNTLYFMDLNDNNRIACVNLSNGGKMTLSQYGTSEYNVAGNYIFYQTLKCDQEGLYRINLKDGTEELVLAGQYNSINTTSKYVYFADYYSGACYHAKLNGHGASNFNPDVEIDKN